MDPIEIIDIDNIEKNKLKESAKRLEQRGDDDSIIPTGYVGRFSEMYNSWMKAGIIYYYINEYEEAKKCFEKSYKYLVSYENDNKNYNLAILVNLCDKNMKKSFTYNVNHLMTYSSKVYCKNFIKVLEKNNMKMTKNLRSDIKMYIQFCEFKIDMQYFIEIIFNPAFIIILFSIMYILY
jgi:tetratricopeptide (TPR) repeat protein